MDDDWGGRLLFVLHDGLLRGIDKATLHGNGTEGVKRGQKRVQRERKCQKLQANPRGANFAWGAAGHGGCSILQCFPRGGHYNATRLGSNMTE
ncbi:hypothetical protein SLA2020_133190 [Shorea laevis]